METGIRIVIVMIVVAMALLAVAMLVTRRTSTVGVEEKDTQGMYVATWLALGMGIGVALGTAFDNLAIGIALGAGFGVGIGSMLDARGESDSDAAKQDSVRLIAMAILLLLTVGAVILTVTLVG